MKRKNPCQHVQFLNLTFAVHVRLADYDLSPSVRCRLDSMVCLRCRPVWGTDRYFAVEWGMAMVQRALVAWEPPIAYSQWPFGRSNNVLILLPTVQACMGVKYGTEKDVSKTDQPAGNSGGIFVGPSWSDGIV